MNFLPARSNTTRRRLASRLARVAGLVAALTGAALGGCAAVPAPRQSLPAAGPTPSASSAAPQTPPQSPQPPPQSPQPSTAPADSALSPQGVAPAEAAAQLYMPAIASMLGRVSAMSQDEAGARQRYLQALGARRRPAQRLELAYLLIARAAPSVDEAARAHDLLRGLDSQTPDAASRQFIRVLQRLSLQTVELAQSRSELAKAQRKAADLQDKIGQIKNLEVQLQGRSQDRAKSPAPKPRVVRPESGTADKAQPRKPAP